MTKIPINLKKNTQNNLKIANTCLEPKFVHVQILLYLKKKKNIMPRKFENDKKINNYFIYKMFKFQNYTELVYNYKNM